MMPLQGLRILDWTIAQVGPFASAALADMGAEVIHLESVRGDSTRRQTSIFGRPTVLPHDRRLFFEEHNRNKLGIVIDLTQEAGREAAYRIVEHCDAFMTNVRKVVVDACKMDYATLSARNPNIIYGSASGFGQKGPDADLPSIDIITCARSGAMMMSGDEDAGPVMLGLGIGDRTASYVFAMSMLAALFGRERHGITQEVHVSQLGSMIQLHGNLVSSHLFKEAGTLAQSVPRHNRENPPHPFYNAYKCKDGRWMALGFVYHGKAWAQILEAMDLTWAKQDPRFNTFEQFMKHRREMVAILDEAFATKTVEEWEAIFKKKDILFAPINDREGLVRDPQVLANGYITDWDHPELGQIKFVGFPYEFSKTPCSFKRAAPKLGEHTAEVLTEVAGYSWEEVGELFAIGAVR